MLESEGLEATDGNRHANICSMSDKPTASKPAGWFQRSGFVLFFLMLGGTIGSYFFGSPTLTESAANPGRGPGRPELVIVFALVGAVVGFFVQRVVYQRPD